MVTGAAKAEAELCLRWGKAAEPAKAEAELCLRCEKAEVIFPGRRQARGDGIGRRAMASRSCRLISGLEMASGRAGLEIPGEGWRWRLGEGKGAGDLDWRRRPGLAKETSFEFESRSLPFWTVISLIPRTFL